MYRIVVTKNNTGMPDDGLNRYVLVGTLLTTAELPEPHHAPLVVESTDDIAELLVGILLNPTTHYVAQEVQESPGGRDGRYRIDLRLSTASEMLRVLGRLVLRRFRS
jgi:hypothetical protein